jgi:hypothetical protein
MPVDSPLDAALRRVLRPALADRAEPRDVFFAFATVTSPLAMPIDTEVALEFLPFGDATIGPHT